MLHVCHYGLTVVFQDRSNGSITGGELHRNSSGKYSKPSTELLVSLRCDIFQDSHIDRHCVDSWSEGKDGVATNIVFTICIE
jgi:hypothetical protein